ncbi:unnamed protein product [Orchesella dallaii]|uniref:Uncharacterized protein n=1 Tax=Orchesella dallaii TaxID=48710 RepID=A0ABP1RKA9_9HEXA
MISSELQPAFYEPVPTKQKYNPFLFQPPGHTFDPTAFFKWLEHGPWPMIKNYLFPECHGCPIYNSRRSVLEVLNYIMDASYRDKHKRARKKTMIEDEFIVAAKDIKTFIGNLKNRLYGNTISTDVPKSYIRQDLQNFLPPGVSDYLVPIEVRDGGMDFYYSTSIAMFADPFCSHALKMSVLYTARKDRTLLPKYASLLAEDVEKVWENMWSAQPPTKTEILILSNILKRRINVYTMEDGGRMDSGVFYDASPIESRERYHLSFVRFKNTYYPLLPKVLSSNSVAAVTPAVLAEPEDCDLDNMLGMDPRFNTDDVDRSPQPTAPTLAFIHNKDNLDVDRSMISIVPFNSQVNPVVVMNAFSETGAQKIEWAISGPTDSVVPDSDDPDEKEISNANLSLYDREGTKHSDFHAPLEKSTCNKALDCSKQTPRTTINGRATCEQNGDINEEEALREVPNVDEQSDHLTLQPTETNARKLFKALRHIHSSHHKYFYASDRYRDLDGFPLVQHILQIHQLCTTCTTVKASVCGHNISGKQLSRLALKNELSRTIYGSFVASDYAVNQREQRLTLSIESKLPGWTVIRSKPDGNCWYNAVSAALVGDQYLGKTLRRCAYLAYLARLQANDETATKFSKKIVTQNLLTDGAWATPSEMYLTSDVVGRRIIVYRTDCQWWSGTYYDADEIQNRNTFPIYILLQGQHFSALAKNSISMTPQPAPYTPSIFRKAGLKKQELLNIIKGNNRNEETIQVVVDLDSDDSENKTTVDRIEDSIGSNEEVEFIKRLDVKVQNNQIIDPVRSEQKLNLLHDDEIIKEDAVHKYEKFNNKNEEKTQLLVDTDLEDKENTTIPDRIAYSKRTSTVNFEAGEENVEPLDEKIEIDHEIELVVREKKTENLASGQFKTDFETLDAVLVLIRTELLHLSKSETLKDLQKYVRDLVASYTTWSRNVNVVIKDTWKKSKRENINISLRIMKLQRHPHVQKMMISLFNELSLQHLTEVYAEALRNKFGTCCQEIHTKEYSAVKPITENSRAQIDEGALDEKASTNFKPPVDTTKEPVDANEKVKQPINIKVEDDSENTDFQEDPIDDECHVSREVLCSILKCSPKDLKYQPPMEFSFIIPSESMAKCFDYSNQTGRFIPGNWVGTLSKCLTAKQKACSFSARSDPFYPKKMTVKGNPVGFCKFRGYCKCGMSFVGTINTAPKRGADCTVTMKSYGVFHLVQDKSTARQLRGRERLDMALELRARNAKTMCLNNLLHLPALRNLHNNHHQKSENVLRKIRSQQTSKMRHHRDPDKEVIHLKEVFRKEDISKGPVLGFIHNSNTSPNELAVWMYQANSLKLHKDQISKGNLTTVHIDATGGVCSNRTSKQILLYVAHAVTDVNGTKISYPLAECLTECQSQLSVSRFLENTRLDMKKLGYHVRMPFANIVVCDFSYAMLHGISRGVNDETLVVYIKRSYKFLSERENWDASKSVIFICAAHLVKAFQRNLYRKLNKSAANKKIVELGLFGIARLQESSSLNELSKTSRIIVRTFGLKHIYESELNKNVSFLKQKKENLQSTEDQENTDLEENVQLTDESTEAETKLLRDSSPFYQLFKRIREYQKHFEVREDADALKTNPYYCPAVINTLEKDYMSVWPIWSNAIERKKGYSDFLRTTNSAIEAEFNLRKQVYKTGRGRLYSDYIRESKNYNESKLLEAVNSFIHSKKTTRSRRLPKRTPDLNSDLKNEKWRKRRKQRTTKYFTPKDAWKANLTSSPNSIKRTQSKLSRNRFKVTQPVDFENDDEIESTNTSHQPSSDKSLNTEKLFHPPTNDDNFGAIFNTGHDRKYSAVSDSTAHETSFASSTDRLIAKPENWGANASLRMHTATNGTANSQLDASLRNGISEKFEPPNATLKINTAESETKYKGRESGYRLGLPNIGNSCYLNSVLQLIMSISDVRLESATSTTTISKYYDVMYKTSLRNTYEYVRTLKAELDDVLPQFKGNEQHDAYEFLLALMSTEALTSRLAETAKITLNKTLLCSCGNVSITEENELCLCIPSTPSVSDGIRLELMDETVEYKCDCGSGEVNCRREVTNSPNSLFVMTKIFDNTGKKVCNFKTVEKNLAFDAIGTPYELKAVITHHGARLNSGHYTAYVYENSQLLCINDENIDIAAKIIGDPYLFLYCKK